jgi:hypothetical protein
VTALLDTGFSESVLISRKWLAENELLPRKLDPSDVDIYTATGHKCSIAGTCKLTFVVKTTMTDGTCLAFNATAHVCVHDMGYTCILGRRLLSQWKIDAPRRRIVWEQGEETYMD